MTHDFAHLAGAGLLPLGGGQLQRLVSVAVLEFQPARRLSDLSEERERYSNSDIHSELELGSEYDGM